jgi:hypothetical protein
MPPAWLAQCIKHSFDHIDVTSTFTVSGAPPVLESQRNPPSDDSIENPAAHQLG